MLEGAHRRGIYDELTQTNLVSFLHGEAASFDVVVAADVLCYFGVLDEVIAAAARRPSTRRRHRVHCRVDTRGVR